MKNIKVKLKELEKKGINILERFDNIDLDNNRTHKLYEKNRKAFIKITTRIYELIKQSKNFDDYNAAYNLFKTARTSLRVYFHDYVSLDFVPMPRI